MVTTKKQKVKSETSAIKKKKAAKRKNRPNELPGKTYKAIVPGSLGQSTNLYVTINDDEHGQPFEIFLSCSDQNLYEWLTSIMLLVSDSLRRGVSPVEIARNLKQVHSPSTSHFIPGGGGLCPSIVARIGLLLEQHYMS